MSSDDMSPGDPGEAADAGRGEYISGEEIGHGYISGVTFTDKLVTFAVVDGRPIFEGDIVLDDVTVVEGPGDPAPPPREAVAELDDDDEGTVQRAVVITGSQFRWPNGIVPFEIDANLPAAQRTAAQNALAQWRSRTRLAFPQRTTEPDWIRFVGGAECSSRIGRRGGRQDITLGPGCLTGQAVHEIAHAVGMWHEQSREDRDRFVTINWANITTAQRHNFDQHITDGDDVGEYDYGSIMHYSRTAFAIDPAVDTITPTQPGAAIGQRTALSAFDTAGVRAIYPNLQGLRLPFGLWLPNPWTYVADFTGDGRQDLLAYLPARLNWWLGSAPPGGVLALRDLGSTAGFGQIGDGRPFWTGRFSGPNRDEILFYFPGDDNWWLGRFDGTALNWSLAGNTAGFGHAINDGRPFWIGDFNGDGKTDVLFYYPGDDNWWLGTHDGNVLRWSFAGNTAGFGHAINDGRPFWTGRFSAPDRDEMLFYYPGDDNWWLGRYDGTSLRWSSAGNTAGFGHAINDGRPFWIGDLDGNGRSDVLFYFPGDSNWWRASHDGTALAWSLAGNTRGFGQVWDGRPFWLGRFAQSDRVNVVFYHRHDGKYWGATLTGGTLAWRMFGDF